MPKEIFKKAKNLMLTDSDVLVLRHWYHTRRLSVTKDGGGREWLGQNHEPIKASSQGVFNLVAKEEPGTGVKMGTN